jgi:O-antigen ligase
MRDWRKHILFYGTIAMIVLLFVSRSLLSVSIIVFVIVAFSHDKIREQFRNFFSSPMLWCMSLLFVLPFLSGAWSDDKKAWLDVTRIKLPLLLLPLAFAAPFVFSAKQWRIIGYVFIATVTAGSMWSMFHYVSDIEAAHEGYLHAKTIITPLSNDHVRFSWLVAVTILFAAWLWLRSEGVIKLINVFIVVWLVVYLHILAARTGLFCFYFIVFTSALWMVFKRFRMMYTIGALFFLTALPILAYFALPTFHNRVKYILYDFTYFKDAHYLPGGNDASRVISLKAGIEITKANAVYGVGFGDVATETVKWYDTRYPGMLPQDKILPSNEWLIYGIGCGIAGLLVFTLAMLCPFFTPVTNKWRWWLLNCLVLLGFLFDIGLEVQFGVFIYACVVLISWKWFRRELGKE